MSSEPYNSIIEDKRKIELKTKAQEKQDLQITYKTQAIYRALFANIGIAGLKLTCWFFSKSSALLSEAIHSLLDSFNSFCLLIGVKRGSRPADSQHPFGYGLEANVWALFASLLMLVGTGVSIYSGVDKLLHQHNHIVELLNNYNWIAVTLFGSIIFEAWAVSSASSAVVKEADIKVSNQFGAFIKSFKAIKKIKSPTTKFVWYEDTAALAGVSIAFIAISISKFVMPIETAYMPDAIASIVIGLILLFLAFYLLKNNMNFLTGSAAGPQTEKLIRNIANNVHGVAKIQELKTMDMGSSGIIINLEIEVNPDTPVKDADDIADRVEYLLKKKIKNVADVTIEMIANDIEDNWEDKFYQVIDEGKKNKVLTKNEAKILKRFFGFTNAVASEIMIPRTEVVFVEINSDISYLIDLIINSGHTRIPVYRDNIDNVVGVINAKDALRAMKENCPADMKIDTLSREIHIIPETKAISDLLNEFTSTKSQFAVVVDEHGGIAGIVTIEDILEEIVGEIYDEFDVVQGAEYQKIDENTVIFDAKMEIEDINTKFDMDLPTEDYQTIGGYVFGLLGREPEVDDKVEDGNLEFIVNSVDGHKIMSLTMVKKEF